MTREVLIPVLLDELQKLEVVLHLTFYEGLDADGLVNLMLGKCVWNVVSVWHVVLLRVWFRK